MTGLAAIIPARMDSRRLPGKALIDLAGMPLIRHVLERLERCGVFDSVVLATTSRGCDDPLAEYFAARGGSVYRGNADEVNDVAGRFLSAAKSVGANMAMRANGDSPFPDCGLIRQGAALLVESPDLVTNLLPRSYPYGISVEILKVSTLEREIASLTEAEREHVTACYYAASDRFRIAVLPACPWPSCPIRLTVDEPGDLAALEQLIGRLPVSVLEADLPTIIAAAQPSLATGNQTKA